MRPELIFGLNEEDTKKARRIVDATEPTDVTMDDKPIKPEGPYPHKDGASLG